MSQNTATLNATERRQLLRQLVPDSVPRALSFSQERLYFLETLTPGTPVYNIPSFMPINAPIDPNILDRVLQEIARRHEILRTRFLMAGGRPLQQVMPNAEIMLELEDLRGLPEVARREKLTLLARTSAETPFDLSVGPLLRCWLIRYDAQRSYFFWCVHHICSDAWSARIFIDELTQLYEAFSQGRPSPLAKLPFQYADYADWQRKHLDEQSLKRLVDYWRKALAGAPEIVSLPADRPRPKIPTRVGAVITARLAESSTASLARVAKSEQATQFMVLHAAFALLIHRLAGHDDIVIGSPVANRNRKETEKLIGFFMNTLALRTSLVGDPTFLELLHRVRENTLEAYNHQQLPFEKLVQELQPQRALSHNPLFQLMLVMQSVPGASKGTSGEANLSASDWVGVNGNGMAKFDLTLFATTERGSFEFGWEYNCDLFDQNTVERFAQIYCRLLDQIAETPERRISQFLLMAPHERVRWEQTARGDTRPIPDVTIPEWFQAQVAAIPDQLAIESSDTRLTYRELDNLANRLAASICAADNFGVAPVGIFLSAGWKAAVAALAVLKSGCPYVPLDASYPSERLDYMVANSSVRIIVSDASLTDRLPKGGVRMIDIEEALASPPNGALRLPCHNSPLAYIMYTSGTTGRPKGVMMPQRSLINLLRWQIDSEQGLPRRTLPFAPLSFDVSFQEIFSTWLSGGTLVAAAPSLRSDFAALWHSIVDHSIQRIFLPYVALQALAEAAQETSRAAKLELVITAGEQLHITPAIAAFFQRLPGAELRNQYGPTETHVVTEHALLGNPKSWPARPPIGRPIANSSVFIVDAYGNPLPVGSPGEIQIGGAVLADGYYQDEQQTAEKFHANPIIPSEPKLYRTGDRGRFLSDGTIEFLGRADDQIKIRGFRVEPGEVTAVLLRHPAVADAVAVAETKKSGSCLLAYLVLRAGESIEWTVFREWCARSLPEYMVPTQIKILKNMPLTPSGKIAVRDLPVITESMPIPKNLTPIEADLCKLVDELLEIQGATPEDDFFALGGHSLLAMRLALTVRAQFHVELPVRVLFERPQLRVLAAFITECLYREDLDATATTLAEIEAMNEADVVSELRGVS